MLNRQNFTFSQNKTAKKQKKLDFFNLTYYLYTERKKKQRKFGYIKICLYICNRKMVGQDPHRWAPSKGSVLFSYLWQRFPWFPLPSQGEPFKKEEKDLVI